MKQGTGLTGFAKENPRRPYVAWRFRAKTHARRQRQLPMDELSCGSQPAHIRMIIVVFACPGSLFHFP